MTTTQKSRSRRVPLVGRTAIYTRVSTDRQSENGASLEVQLDACRRYCDQNGLEVVAEFRDVESGLHSSRPQYRKALELAKTQGIDKLVTWRYDRLGRDAAEYLTQLKVMKKIGVDVVSVTQPTESQFMMGMLGLMAEEESRTISTRVLESKHRRFQEGYWGGPPPFGYDSVKVEGGSVLRPNKDSPLVTEMFSRYASGKVSLWRLQTYLREHGIAKSYGGLSYALKNPLYLGRLRHGRYARSPFTPKAEVVEYQGLHEPLTTPEIFQRVQERLAQNHRRQGGGPTPRYLFSGLLRCGICGRRYVGRRRVASSGRLERFYVCGRRVSTNDCRSHSMPEGRLRDAVLEPIRVLLEGLSEGTVREEVRAQLAKEAEEARRQVSSAHGGLAAMREKLESRLSKLEDGWLDGHISKARYLQRRDVFMAQLEDLKKPLAESSAPEPTSELEAVMAMAQDLTITDLTDGEWRIAVETVVDKIEVVGGKGTRQARITVHWRPGFEAVVKAIAAVTS